MIPRASQAPLVAHRARVGNGRHKQELAVIAVARHEVGVCLQEQRITCLQLDVADLPDDALAVAVHRDDRGVVAGPERSFSNRLADEGRRVADHHLDQQAVAAWSQ